MPRAGTPHDHASAPTAVPAPAPVPQPERRRVVVAGASGLIGTALVASLRADDIDVHTLVRRPTNAPHEHAWLGDDTALDPEALEGAAAVVSLGGASIGRIPWTPAYQRELRASRLRGTTAIARAVRHLGTDAPVFVSASAVGYYGSQPGEVLDEYSAFGRGFLVDLVRDWEAAALSAGEHARVTLLRTAPVVHAQGVLAPMIRLTNVGLGGPLGAGTQASPWISLVDEVRAIRHVLDHELAGPINLAGPTRATSNDLGFALAMGLGRPFLVRAPAVALRAALGREMADGLLLADAHVVPRALQASGFTFTHERVEDAVADAVAETVAIRLLHARV